MTTQITRIEKEFRISVDDLMRRFCFSVKKINLVTAIIDIDIDGPVLVLKVTEEPDTSYPTIVEHVKK